MSYNQQTSTKILVVQFNVRDITNTSDINQLEHVLNENQIDVVFINKTLLKSDVFLNFNL